MTMGGEGGPGRPRYIGSMSTYIKEVYKSAKKKINYKGGGLVLYEAEIS